MKLVTLLSRSALAAVFLLLTACHHHLWSGAPETDPPRVLVFSKTAGFRHQSIEKGVETIRDLGQKHGFDVEATEDAAIFNTDDLARFEVILFLNTTRNVLEKESERTAFQKFVRDGGGFVGVHAAADTGYDWPWYGQLVGAWFKSHPKIQEARVTVEDHNHPATRHLDKEWVRTDEWYSFRSNPRKAEGIHVLLALDTSSFEGSEMGDDHPIAWYHHFEGGRAVYTGLGHTEESYDEEAFRAHLVGAIRWAAGVEEGEKREEAR